MFWSPFWCSESRLHMKKNKQPSVSWTIWLKKPQPMPSLAITGFWLIGRKAATLAGYHIWHKLHVLIWGKVGKLVQRAKTLVVPGQEGCSLPAHSIQRFPSTLGFRLNPVTDSESLLFKIFKCVCVSTVHMWRSKDSLQVSSLLSPCGFWVSNAGHQTWWQVLPLYKMTVFNA